MNTQPIHEAEVFFDEWVKEKPDIGRGSLSAKSASTYRYVWLAWVKFLGTATTKHQPTAWTGATMTHIDRFLTECAIPSSGRRKATAPISEQTKKRYLRLLGWLYAHAVKEGRIRQNPVSVRESAITDEMSQVFNEVQWQLIVEQLPKGDSIWDIRDRAILSLLMDQGLTTGEICGLMLRDINTSLRPFVLTLDGQRKAQARTLKLEEESASCLREWLEVRQRRSSVNCEGKDHVFVTQKGFPMSSRPLFHLVATTVVAAHKRGGLEIPAHVGPAVLRNTRIVKWLNAGVDATEVSRRAGHKDTRSLRCLRQHIRKDVLDLVLGIAD